MHRAFAVISGAEFLHGSMSFSARLGLVILLSAIAAAIVSPFAAAGVAALGFHFPFPRIFDRTIMVIVAIAIVWQARALGAAALLKSGFDRPARSATRATRGFLVAIVAVAALILIAAVMGAHARESAARIWAAMPKLFVSAIAIAVIEEAFFRAFLLGGMEGDFGRTRAVVLSSAIYSIAHLIRSPAKYYLSGIHPLAGFTNLAASLARLGHPLAILPTVVGLFLLGIVLAEAFLRTGTVYYSIGLHAGFVVGAKLWPDLTGGGTRLPAWFSGWGPQPLISGVAAWVIALALIALIRPLTRASRT